MPEITEVEEKITAVETEISEVKAEIVGLKGGRDWRSLSEEDKAHLKRLEEEKIGLQTEKNILLQQQLLLLSATAGNTYSSSHALPL